MRAPVVQLLQHARREGRVSGEEGGEVRGLTGVGMTRKCSRSAVRSSAQSAAAEMPALVRRGRERGMSCTCVMTEAASRFVAPLALAAVSGNKILDDLLFSKCKSRLLTSSNFNPDVLLHIPCFLPVFVH